MDQRPFLVLDLLDIDENLLPEIRKLARDAFDLTSVLSAAEELKYVGALKRAIAAQFKEPDEDFVRLFTSRVYDGRFTKEARSQFTTLVTTASKQFLNEQVNDRLKTALGASYSDATVESEHDPQGSEQTEDENVDRETQIETTLEELEGYKIVKVIGCGEVKPQRIVYRDAKSYCAVLLDDNNRKTIARLWFNGKKQKYLGLLDEDKNETRHPINTLEQIYEHADAIRHAVRALDD